MDKSKLLEEVLNSAMVMNEYLLVKPISNKEVKTASGIVLSSSRTEESIKFASVVKKGALVNKDKPNAVLECLNVGDIVAFQNMGHDAFPSFMLDPSDSDSKYFLLNSSFVLMCVSKDKLVEVAS